MAKELSLDTITEIAQEDYADIVIPLLDGQAVTLLHPMRLSDEKRDELVAFFEVEASDGEEPAEKAKPEDGSDEEPKSALEHMQGLLRIVSATEPEAELLFEALAGDLTKHQAVVKFYMESANPGEA